MDTALTWADIKSKKKPMERTVWISTDTATAQEFDTAKGQVLRAEAILESRTGLASAQELERMQADVEAAQQAFEEAEANARKNSIPFTFRAMGRTNYEAMVADHPPTQKQISEARRKKEQLPPFDADTFVPTLISKSLINPELSYEQVVELMNDESWNGAEWNTLWLTALEVNSTRRVVELGNVSSGTNGSDSN